MFRHSRLTRNITSMSNANIEIHRAFLRPNRNISHVVVFGFHGRGQHTRQVRDEAVNG